MILIISDGALTSLWVSGLLTIFAQLRLYIQGLHICNISYKQLNINSITVKNIIRQTETTHIHTHYKLSTPATMYHPTINEIITEDYRAALILDAYGIDFCDSGQKTLEQVSKEQHLDKHILDQALSNLKDLPPHWDYVAWDTSFLVAFIVHTHHNYIRETLPKLGLLATIVLAKDEPGHPEMKPIEKWLIILDQSIKQHLISEEYALFPYLLEMDRVRISKQTFVASTYGRLEKPILEIEKDHTRTAHILKEIRELSQHFQPPPGACRECTVWYQMLKEFDADMRLHIHLESNILFPRALALEAQLSGNKGDIPTWVN